MQVEVLMRQSHGAGAGDRYWAKVHAFFTLWLLPVMILKHDWLSLPNFSGMRVKQALKKTCGSKPVDVNKVLHLCEQASDDF